MLLDVSRTRCIIPLPSDFAKFKFVYYTSEKTASIQQFLVPYYSEK
jgi:hypothetical protein